MKSKDIVKEFIQLLSDVTTESHQTAMKFILKQFMDDLYILIKVRNIQYDRGLVPIFNELNSKWISCYNQLQNHYGESLIVKDGFEKILELKFPPAYQLFKNQK